LVGSSFLVRPSLPSASGHRAPRRHWTTVN
jgi:hypothetical protein